MKTCTRCGVCKPLDQFLWRVKAKGYRQPHCKSCGNVQAQNWKKNNPEKVAASNKRYAEENREIMKIKRREYYLRIKAADPDKLRERTRLWKASPKGRATTKAWYKTPYGREFNRRISKHYQFSQEVFAWWQSLGVDRKCSYCGISGLSGVQMEIDHIVPASKGGPSELWNLTPSCKPCNRVKRDMDVDVFLEQFLERAS